MFACRDTIKYLKISKIYSMKKVNTFDKYTKYLIQITQILSIKKKFYLIFERSRYAPGGRRVLSPVWFNFLSNFSVQSNFF